MKPFIFRVKYASTSTICIPFYLKFYMYLLFLSNLDSDLLCKYYEWFNFLILSNNFLSLRFIEISFSALNFAKPSIFRVKYASLPKPFALYSILNFITIFLLKWNSIKPKLIV